MSAYVAAIVGELYKDTTTNKYYKLLSPSDFLSDNESEDSNIAINNNTVPKHRKNLSDQSVAHF